MFSAATNGSKVALIALCRALHEWEFPLLDAQVASPHLHTLGAFEMLRSSFLGDVVRLCAQSPPLRAWSECWPCSIASDLA